MSFWDDRVHQHEAQTVLKELESRVARLRAHDDRPHSIDKIERVRATAAFTRARLDAADAQYVSEQVLGRLTDAVNELLINLDAYMSAQDDTSLDQLAVDGCDQVLYNLTDIPVAESQSDVGAIRDAVESFRRAQGQLVRGLREEVEAALSDVSSLESAISSASDDLKKQMEPLRQSLESFGTQLESQKTRLDTALNEFQSASSNAIVAFKSQIGTLAKQGEANLSEVGEAGKKRFDDAVSELVSETNDVMLKLHGLKQEAENVVGAIGSTGMTGGFQKYADQQKREADKWRRITSLSLASLVIVGLLILFSWRNEEFGSAETVGKLFVTIPLAAFAAYAGNQSTIHRRRERTARQFELEVAAFDPYIVLLPEEQRNELKFEMAKKIFGRADRDGGEPSPATVEQIVERLIPNRGEQSKN